MDTCQFSYVRKIDDAKRTVIGVEQSWNVLCVKLNREGPGIQDGTDYFTISVQGPELFAVDGSGTNVYYHDEGKLHRYITAFNDNSVFYHDHGKWHQYITACNIKFGTMESNNPNPCHATSDDIIVHKVEDESDWILVSQDK